MNLKSLTFVSAAVLALSGVCFAAPANDANKPAATSTLGKATDSAASATGTAASKATTEVEKAVGAGDSFTQAELGSAVMLSKVADAKNKLASAKVDDPTGHIIGPVKDVMTGAGGMASQIHVDVGGWLGVGEKVVAMDAKDFTYIPERNILVTKMSKAAIEKLPAIKG